VNYRGFRNNKLIKKPGLVIPRGVNNYGLKLKTLKKEKYARNTSKESKAS
jgi:hypothetical protein